ncbi:MAG: STAS domain-containing protein [Candidatus Eisenbacteria bacterium]|nr:STAS domain-containing protein [Candidatus Eisenbacteria bacterium]
MKVKTRELGAATYLTPDGSLTEENLESIRESVRSAGAGGSANLVIDCRRVPSIDSGGLEFLQDLSTEMRDAGGSLRLANVSPVCKDILALTRLDQVIPVYEDIENAGRSFL